MSSRSVKKRPSTKRKHPVSGVLMVFTVILVAIVGCGIAGFAVGNSWLTNLPDYSDADLYNTSEPTVVYASDGTTELARFQLEFREAVDQSEISPYVLQGTVATEDERFYSHNGIDIAGIVRALANNLMGGELEGASTITQQFVRNTILADEMDDISLKRKVREAYIALDLEKKYSKDEILTMYLNTINYGCGAYGIQAASQRYFSKNASDLTLAEAALLIGIPQSPTFNNPVDYPDNALERRNLVLDRMLSNGYITQAEHDAAQAEPIVLNMYYDPSDGIYAYPYYTSYVKQLLYSDYGLSESDILQGGLKVVTALDTDLQDDAEAAAEYKRDLLGGDLDVAMAVIEPSTGYVRAIVGGADYSESQVNIATGQGGGGRPCGSAFKVFTLVTALKNGISPNTYIDCTSPATIDNYTVQNYDNINYGTRTITRALAVSSNTGFVRLISSLGPESVAETAREMGISSTLSPETAGATLTLGVENVTPLEMAEAFATIATGGIHIDSTPIITITDSAGNVIVDNTDPEARSERVISEEVAHAAEKVMENVITSSEGTGYSARLASGQTAAGKTGTTESYQDITFFGITPQYSVGIWCGDPSNATTVPVGTTCADVFSNFLDRVLDSSDVESFPMDNASDPTYTEYTDTKYHIYGTSGYYSSSSSSSYSSTATTDTTTTDTTTTDTGGGTADAGGGGGTADAGGGGGTADAGGGGGTADAGGGGGTASAESDSS